MAEARKDGFESGYSDAVDEQGEAFSACLALALSKDFGYTKEQIIAVQDACNNHVQGLTAEIIRQTIKDYLTEELDESEGDTTTGVRGEAGDTPAEPEA